MIGGFKMINEEKIKRINELYKKAKADGLTNSEKKEQESLRKEYLAAVRQSLKYSLDSVKVVDEQGNDITPKRNVKQ